MRHQPILRTALLTTLFVGHVTGQHLPGNSNANGYATDLSQNYGLFAANDQTLGMELWRVDHSTQIASLVRDIAPGSTGSHPQSITPFQSGFVFAADDGTNGVELWRTNGTNAGTVMVANINAGGSSRPHGFTVVGTRVFFVADDGVHGDELWSYDGTTASLALDIAAGVTSSAPRDLCAFGSVLLFAANNGASGRELWRSDGTGAGTQLVKDIAAGTDGSGPRDLVNAGIAVLFVADDGVVGSELWRSDGTTAGTTLVKDIEPGSVGSAPGALHWQLNTIFAATTTAAGRELWMSDGTTAGTTMIADLNPGAAGSDPQDLTTNGFADLWFVADDAVHGRELWQVNISGTGLVRKTDLLAGSGSVDPRHLVRTSTAGRFVFSDATSNILWATDASPEGASAIASFRSGPSGLTRSLNLFGAPSVFFTAEDNTTGIELWRTDGTIASTAQVENIAAEVPGWALPDLKQHGGGVGGTVTICIEHGDPNGLGVIAFSTSPGPAINLPFLFKGPFLLGPLLTTVTLILDASGDGCITIAIPVTISTIELAEQGFSLDPFTGLPFSATDLGSLGITSLSNVPLFGGAAKTVGVFDDKDHRFEVSTQLPTPGSGTHPPGTFEFRYRLNDGSLSAPINSYGYDGKSVELFFKDTLKDTSVEFQWIEMWFHPDKGNDVFVWKSYC